MKYVEKSSLSKSTFSKKSFFNPVAGYLKKYENFKLLYLSSDSIRTDVKAVYFEAGDTLEIKGFTTDKIYIKDRNGKEKFSIAYEALLSADIFIAFLSNRLEKGGK